MSLQEHSDLRGVTMNHALQKTRNVTILALICCALWGSAFPFVKVSYDWFHIEGIPSQILFAGYRFFLSGVLTFIIGSFIEKRLLTIKRSSIPAVFGQGLLQTTIQYAFFYIGLAHTTGTKGSVIDASSSFIAIIAAHFLIKSERMTWTKTLGCTLGFLGVIVINLTPGSWENSFQFKGEGLLCITAIAYGLSTVTSKLLTARESPITVTAYQLLFGGGTLIVIGLLMKGSIGSFDAKGLILFTYLVFLSAAGFGIWTILLKYNPVKKIAIFGFTIPIFGVALSALLLNEELLSLRNLLSLTLVSAGILIVNHVKKETAKTIEPRETQQKKGVRN